MRKLIFSILLILFVFHSNAQITAVKYLEKMGDEYKKISKDTWDYTSAVAHDKSARKIEKRRMELLKTIYSAKATIRRMGGYKGNTEFRDSVIVYLEIHYAVIDEDYEKIVDMEEVAERSYDIMEAYLMAQDMASDRLNQAGDIVDEGQKKFAAANNINLIESESKIGKKQKAANEVFDYYRPVYLIFFKPWVQQLNLTDAMNSSDISTMEQSKAAMITYSEEGLMKLKTIKSFKGDITITRSCKEMLDFLKEESVKSVPALSDYILKKENFEKVKAAFDTKKASKRTKADVDQYNKAVNDMNKASEEYNKTNETLNKGRSKALGNWNKSVKNFLSKHTPRG